MIKNSYKVLLNKNINLTLPAYAAIGAVLLATAGYSFYAYQKAAQHAASMQHQHNPILLPQKITNPTDNQPSLIHTVSIEGKRKLTKINLQFTKQASYRLSVAKDPNKVMLTFYNTQLQTQLPEINELSSSIEQIQSQKINRNLRFKLLLQPGSSIKYVHLIDQHKNPPT